MTPRFPIPTGLHPSAQGCRVREATLGHALHFFPQPQRGCITPRRAVCCNPVGVGSIFHNSPRVARASQPWAERRSPVGADGGRAVRPKQSRIHADLHPIPHARHPARHAAAEAAERGVERGGKRKARGGNFQPLIYTENAERYLQD